MKLHNLLKTSQTKMDVQQPISNALNYFPPTKTLALIILKMTGILMDGAYHFRAPILYESKR